MKSNIIKEKSFDFALKIIELYRKLTENKEHILSRQLLRSGTSIGANIEEAIAAHSTKDFISKLTIALKEARESRYWLMLLDKSQIVKINYSEYLNDIDQIISILCSILKTMNTKNK